MSKIWVIEMLIDGRWETTVGAYLTREWARDKKEHDWEYDYPNDKFRIKKYIREDDTWV
jgi:hypothetical protein